MVICLRPHIHYTNCVFIIEYGNVFGQERYRWIDWKVNFYFSSHRVSRSEMWYFAQVFATFGFTFPLFCNIPENQGSDFSSFSTLNKCYLCQASIDRANVCCYEFWMVLICVHSQELGIFCSKWRYCWLAECMIPLSNFSCCRWFSQLLIVGLWMILPLFLIWFWILQDYFSSSWNLIVVPDVSFWVSTTLLPFLLESDCCTTKIIDFWFLWLHNGYRIVFHFLMWNIHSCVGANNEDKVKRKLSPC